MLLLSPASAQAGPIEIEGLGFFGNRSAEGLVEDFAAGPMEEEFFGPAVLDGALVLIDGRIRRDGFLAADFEVEGTTAGGEVVRATWTSGGLLDFPGDLQLTEARIRVHRGVRYFYNRIEFEGLEEMDHETARSFFYPADFLFQLRRFRPYSPSRFESSLNSLRDAYRQRGYQNIRIKKAAEERDPATGAVRVTLEIASGARHRVARIEERLADGVEGGIAGARLRTEELEGSGPPFSRIWEQERKQALRVRLYEAGYPNPSIETRVLATREKAGEVWMDLELRVDPGPRVRVAEVRFEGAEGTRRSFLRDQLDFAEGDWLDPARVEEGRYEMARTGAFQRIEVHTEAVEGDPLRRRVIYDLEPVADLTVSLLAGWGSYELLRGGVDIKRRNLWGMGHRDGLELIQSFRSTSAEYRYSVPDLLGEGINVTGSLFFLRREEVSFERREWGAALGLESYSSRLDASYGIRYEFERNVATELEGSLDRILIDEKINVGKIAAFINLDRRDNVLYPTDGYQLRIDTEIGSPILGGQTDFQRVNLRGSWHHPLGSGLFLHVGVRHQFVTTWGGDQSDLPINKRFFPGGENSIRGYSEGEASPLVDGTEVGAETLILGTVEIEQALTPGFSVVLFSDQLLQGQDVASYPGEDYLSSVGLGLRMKTPLGPFRLEGAHNLNQREGDPDYTIHFSLGFPF